MFTQCSEQNEKTRPLEKPGPWNALFCDGARESNRTPEERMLPNVGQFRNVNLTSGRQRR